MIQDNNFKPLPKHAYIKAKGTELMVRITK